MFAVEVLGELGVYVAMDAGRERPEVSPSRVDR